MKADFKLYTMEDAEKEGLAFEPQEEKPCPFCGMPLEQLGRPGTDGVVHWFATTQCDCEGQMAENERVEAEERRAREEAALRAMAAKCRSAGIGRRYLEAKVSQKPCIDYVNGFADAGGKGLYLVGGVGAGKTHEASAIARSFIWSGYSVLIATSLTMLDSIYGNQHGQPTRGTADFCNADLLIIDDLGKENANQWAVTTLFQVVNSRYENMLPTVFTSQYALPDLERRMSRGGETESARAIVSRIGEMCETILLSHPDRRRRGQRRQSELRGTL